VVAACVSGTPAARDVHNPAALRPDRFAADARRITRDVARIQAGGLLSVSKHGDFYYFTDSAPGSPRPRLSVQDGRKNPRLPLLGDRAAPPTAADAWWRPTKDGKLVGYLTAEPSGNEWLEIRVRDVRTAKDLPDRVRWVRATAIAWTHDGKGFFYTCHAVPRGGDQLVGPEQIERVCYHWLGKPQSADELIIQELSHPAWHYDVSVTPDGVFAIVSITDGAETKNRIYLIDLTSAKSPTITAPVFRLIDDPAASYRVVDNSLTTLLVITDDGAVRGRLLAIDVAAPNRENWRQIVRESDARLVDAEPADDGLVMIYLAESHSVLRVTTLRGSPRAEVPLPDIGLVSAVHGALNDPELFFRFTPVGGPPVVYQYDVRKRTRERVELPPMH
jgi:prolyl oligopeptidase